MFSELLTEAQKAAIADVTIASSELETEVERCIIELCRLWWPHGSILLENMRVESKLNTFHQLLVADFKSNQRCQARIISPVIQLHKNDHELDIQAAQF